MTICENMDVLKFSKNLITKRNLVKFYLATWALLRPTEKIFTIDILSERKQISLLFFFLYFLDRQENE